ncbi:MAG: 50S ribosomal protein L3 N(5)-glutamine methyltransferase, partial [Gammaproteobacteria bacterium]
GLELEPEQLEKLQQLIDQRIETRRPAAYLTGEAWFAGVKFSIDERVIVPRSPIAELLVGGFAPWVDPRQVSSVLDLCAGSGCIALVAAMVFESARVEAAELSVDALQVAAENRSRLGLEQRVLLTQSDLFSALGGHRYDLIISNPPYVPQRRQLPAEYGHEPTEALFAGEDGLDLAIPILARSIDHLNPGGWLVLEVGEAMEALITRIPTLPGIWMELEGEADGVLMISREELVECETVLRELDA